MNFNEVLNNKIDKVNNALEGYLKNYKNPQKSIYEAMAYSLFAGGKRLRPVLMMSVCDMLGGDEEFCLPFAAAIEMIHTSSLIHDDLPAMDNDVLRRGKPTNHVVFGEAIAILAGDALLIKAFEIVAECGLKNVNQSNVLRAIRMLAEAAGSEGMIGGQVVDIESEGKNIDGKMLEYIHLYKTGAIIRACATIGAVLANADEKQISTADAFARSLGMAFQIQDDVLDVEGDEQNLGKPIGSDTEKNKNTYVSLYGMEKSKQLICEYSSRAIDTIGEFGEKAEFLINLVKYLIDRKS
ncbi:MAG: polyprenyl synthetase family protein [Clostridia bacterium]|nr:polyprenyl synthetase family protein [Clostridia bacterium]